MARLGGGIAQRFAQLVDRGVEAVVEVHDGVVTPQPLPHLFAGHQFAGPVQQHHQHLEGLRVQLDADAVFAQLSRGFVEFERAKAKHAGLRFWAASGTIQCKAPAQIGRSWTNPDPQYS